MKNITIAGGITRDAVVHKTQNGDAACRFSVAVDHRDGREKTTMYFDCALWGKRGEALAQYLTKGSRVAVSGDLGTREHEGRTYLTVRADQVTLLGGGQQGERARTERPQGQSERQAAAPYFDDSEIPF